MGFVVCGTGWRAEMIISVLSLYEEELGVASIFTHSTEQRDRMIKRGYSAFTELDKALSVPHLAVIVATRGPFLPSLLIELTDRGERVISETSFLELSSEEEAALIDRDIYVLEQYMLTPILSSARKLLPLIGEVSQLRLSGLHAHHAASVMRHILSFNGEDIAPLSYDYRSVAIKTGERAGRVPGSESKEYTRRLRIAEVDGKLFINDHSTDQYHNFLHSFSFEIRGERGTITEDGVIYIGEDQLPVRLPFVLYYDREKFSHSSSLSYITAGDRVVYTNRYRNRGLSDDEIAILDILFAFKNNCWHYKIREAIIDARIGRRL